MDVSDLLWWAGATAFTMYGVALGVIAVARRRSDKIAQRTARFWRHELGITTWVLATPGLIAAAYGMIIMIGFVLFPLGIAVGVIATRVSLGKRSVAYALPLIFVGAVDLYLLVSLVGSGDPSLGSDWLPALGVATYLAVATANAVRIFRRGRNNSRLRRTAAPDSEVQRDPNPTPGAFTPPLELYRATAARVG